LNSFQEMQRMRTRKLLPALLLGVGLLGLTALPAAAEKVDAKKIAKLIEDLGSDTFADRQKANETLDAIGEPALEALRKATKSRDAEIRKRAADLVSKIETRVQSGRVLKPTMVHLVFKNTPVADAVAELRKKSGYLVVLHDPDGKLKDKKVTLDTGKVTFWNALEQLCSKAGVTEGDPNANRFNRPFPLPVPVKPIGGGGLPAGKGVAVPGGAKVLPAREVKKDDIKKAKEEEKQKAAKEEAARQAEEAARQAKEAAQKQQAAQQAKPNVVVVGGGVAGAGQVIIQPALPPGGGPAIMPPELGGGVAGAGQPGQITLVPGKTGLKADGSTSIRVRPADKKNFRQTDKEIALFLEVTPEPKVRLHNIMSVAIDKALDDNGQKLSLLEAQGGGAVDGGPGGVKIMILPGGGAGAPGWAGGLWMPPSNNGLSHNTPVRLKAGTKASKSLKELTGTISAQVLGEAEQMLAVDKLMKSAGKTFKGKQGGDIKVLTAKKLADGTVQITFEFELPAGVVPETQINAPFLLNPPPLPPVKALPPGGAAGGAGKKVGARVGFQVEAKPAVAGKALPAQPAQAIAQPAIGIAVMPGGMPFMPQFAYNGLTLRDEKGNVLPASIFPNWRKGGFAPGAKMEYVATTYKHQGKTPAEPAKLVFTARRQIAVSIPFKLQNVELK
jgi:hypothetical protein